MASFDLAQQRNYSEICGTHADAAINCTYCGPEATFGVYGFGYLGDDIQARRLDFYRRDALKSPAINDTSESLVLAISQGSNCTAISCYWGNIYETPSNANRFQGQTYLESEKRDYASFCMYDLRSFLLSEKQTVACRSNDSSDEFVILIVMNAMVQGNYWEWQYRNDMDKRQTPPLLRVMKMRDEKSNDENHDETNMLLLYADYLVVVEDYPLLLTSAIGVVLGIIYGIIFFCLPENYGDMLIELQLLARAKEEEDNNLVNK